MIHLDTGFLIHALVPTSAADEALRGWLVAGEPLAMSYVAWAELLCGPLTPRQAELAARVVAERIPFAEEDAAEAARLFNLSDRRRGSLADCMIAATALRCGARLATTNRRDFVPFEDAGLDLVDS